MTKFPHADAATKTFKNITAELGTDKTVSVINAELMYSLNGYVSVYKGTFTKDRGDFGTLNTTGITREFLSSLFAKLPLDEVFHSQYQSVKVDVPPEVVRIEI